MEAESNPALLTRALRPFQRFVATEAAGGVVLLVCTVVALAWANSPWAHSYFELWEHTFTIGFDGAALSKSVHHWINDGLMVAFFLLVGLEIKREMLAGELASIRRAALPVAAALGGMVVPALIYVALNAGHPGSPGWAIPVATDIAFALGVLALLGSGIPASYKIFLAAFAIADDIGAVLVIALFYTAELSLGALAAAAAIVVALLVVNKSGVRHLGVYLLLGVALWLAVLKSGIHATIAGVLLAATIPMRTRINDEKFGELAEAAIFDFRAASASSPIGPTKNAGQQEALHQLTHAIEDVHAPLMELEAHLHTVVAFVIMPLFAFANAGVALTGDIWTTLDYRIVLGIVLGLIIGKTVGITVVSWLAARFGMAQLPADLDMRALSRISWLGGIGFTMSLFVASLAFGPGSLLDSAKVGILAASLVAGVAGFVLLRGSGSSARRPPGQQAGTSLGYQPPATGH